MFSSTEDVAILSLWLKFARYAILISSSLVAIVFDALQSTFLVEISHHDYYFTVVLDHHPPKIFNSIF